MHFCKTFLTILFLHMKKNRFTLNITKEQVLHSERSWWFYRTKKRVIYWLKNYKQKDGITGFGIFGKTLNFRGKLTILGCKHLLTTVIGLYNFVVNL